jgi:hypothetical protein
MRLWVRYLVIGAVSCWGPGVILAAAWRQPGDWQVANAFLPMCACVVYLILRKLRHQSASPSKPSLAGAMLLGIYIGAPWFITLESTFLGRGFSEVRTWLDWTYLLIESLVPIYTIVLSTYDLSLLGLGVVTVFLIVAHWKWEETRWIFPFRRQKVQPIT